MFYNSYAKSVIKYGLLAYGATSKTTLQSIKYAKRRGFWAFLKNN